MAEITYDEALKTIIEHTEIGYTIASQDRLWIVFIFDLWSDDQFRYNRLFPCEDHWAYDLTIRGVKVWTSRREAEEAAEQLREDLATAYTAQPSAGQMPEGPTPEVYVMNLGDDARYEALIIGRDNGRPTRTTPKFKGSQEAWDAMIEMSKKWLAENSG